jgi:hypothetical protein
MLAQNVENWKREIYAEGELRGELRGKLEMALKMVRRFNVSAQIAAEEASVSVKELMDYMKKHDKS